jgi:SagB-type dehydrogenase family enzyme
MPQFFLHKFFHHETSDRAQGGLVRIPVNPDDWPESWKQIAYKEYTLRRPIPLPETASVLFDDYLAKRKSPQRQGVEQQVTLGTLSTLLRCGYGLRERTPEQNGRTVPSAGGLYPIEIYIILFRPIETCAAGVYHYNIKRHALEPVLLMQFSPEEINAFAPAHPWLAEMTGMIILTSVFHRTTEKYGDRGYRYILLEAGHIAQNILLAGVEQETKVIPIGGVDEGAIERSIGLSGAREQVVYVLYF